MERVCSVSKSGDLSRYLDGELLREKKKEIEEHLQTCSLCARERDILQNARTALRDISAVSETPNHWVPIRGRLLAERKAGTRQEGTRSSSVSSFSWKKWAPLAAAILLLALGLSQFWPFGAERATGVESYLGLYLLAASADDRFCSEVSADELETLRLNFRPHAPLHIDSWNRTGIYYHRIHGQPLLQAFYLGPEGEQYCVFMQSGEHSLDFGNRDTRNELVRNRLCTKLIDRQFSLISWRHQGTLFTLVSTWPDLDVIEITSNWIASATSGTPDF